MSLQRTYSINPDVGFRGQIAEPNSPHRIEAGRINIPAAATRQDPHPGDSVFYNTGDNAWQVPDNAANMLVVSGILTYRADAVQNVNSELIIADGDQIFVVTMGVVWVVYGDAAERGQQVTMEVGTGAAAFQYTVETRVTAVADLFTHPMECYSGLAANNQVGKVAIGYGRAI